ncbi:pyridoxamine 5'-phosphate oxidase family protein [Desulfurivibrio alkaliphilus]|uniref:Pyridoxamine 5'-phosphate oxidase-related FMN-binding protein n=1 Tax=Desulfurivibrio alkaliphilus (strain DSM 19089 / UNIQEM U267 / AHT2) TaxID=589865 RepID=D6Z5R3_DESAT|nr:pyridoxamine 5'-phosphate oxidase family protein [Desulfurivibrio alkaliphilus]ADH86800.1 pyridoxamine 5'-phosphate oxidase-related FMN-binding protein [Desulfurivibrio alkaliphilus AHT 2]
MKIDEYFAGTRGRGILATAAANGKVDAAVYSTPHCQQDGTVAFVMRDRLTHRNVKENPHATYLYIEEGQGVRGVRLFLKKIKEETDPEKIKALKRRHLTAEEDEALGPTFLVSFAVEKILPLVGADPANLPIS